MKPFRRNVAIAIDGGGIKGVLVARALSLLEQDLGQSCHDIFRLTAGTSTGSILSAGIAAGLSATEMYRIYCELGENIFKKTIRSTLWPLYCYRYPSAPLESALKKCLGDRLMKDFWSATLPTDVVITIFDLLRNHTCFIKPWKAEYADWPVVKTVLASCSVPTYFPAVEGRYIDGGVGSYSNPCYLAAYEAQFCLKWNPRETTLISLGTGRSPHSFQPGNKRVWEWISPILGAFLQSADDQQVHLVRTFFNQLDFRRFQVDFSEVIEMDDAKKIPLLTQYGAELGRKILNDQTESEVIIEFVPPR